MHTAEKYELLLSTISHEIRNPVTLINSYLQLISSAHPEVASFEYWDTVGEEMQHLRTLLTDLSLFNNSMRLHPTSLALNDWLTGYAMHAQAFLKGLSDANQQTILFRSEFEPDLPTISADPDKLQQVLDNLIRNAAEAVFSGLEAPAFAKGSSPFSGQITLLASVRDATLFLTVSDNGCGILPEQLPHLFEPFTSYKANGTGLGLSIVQRIIKAHHGTITVHSEPFKETRFIISLPLVSSYG